MDILLSSINFFTCLFMMGLIWFVQIVHYPLFAEVRREDFAAYERRHAQRTTMVTFPVMSLELLSGVGLVVVSWGNDWPWLWIGMLGLIGLLWIVTVFVAVPLHARLVEGFDPRVHRKLLQVNWLRTVAWTARSGVWVWVLLGK